MAFDDFSKQMFKHHFKEAIITEVKVGQFEKSFDFFIRGTHPSIVSSQIIPQEFKDYVYNIVEYKSHADTYTHADVMKLIGDFAYFCTQLNITVPDSLTQCGIWFLISDPTYLVNHFTDFGLISEERKQGFYILEQFRPMFRVVVLEELDAFDISNALLLLMASPEKFVQFITAQVNNDELIRTLRKFINQKFILEGRKVRETPEVSVVKNKVDYYANQNIKDSIEDLGVLRVIEAVGLPRVIEAVGLPRVIKEIGLDTLVETLDDDQKQELVNKLQASKSKEQKQKGSTKKRRNRLA